MLYYFANEGEEKNMSEKQSFNNNLFNHFFLIFDFKDSNLISAAVLMLFGKSQFSNSHRYDYLSI